MAFLRAAAGWFRAYTWAARAHSGSPSQAFLGSRDSPLRCLSPDPPLRGLVTHPGGVT